MKSANSQTVVEDMLARGPRPGPISRASLACGAANELPSHVHHMPGKLESWGPVLDPYYKQVFASCLTVMTHCDCCNTCSSGLAKTMKSHKQVCTILKLRGSHCVWQETLTTVIFGDGKGQITVHRYGRQRHLEFSMLRVPVVADLPDSWRMHDSNTPINIKSAWLRPCLITPRQHRGLQLASIPITGSPLAG